MDIGEHYLDNARLEFGRLKRLAEKALAQVEDDEALHHALDAESNSLAVLLQHLAGNLTSRWTDFLTTDGEKAFRDRDGEFEAHPGRTRKELMDAWELGWSRAQGALASLKPGDLERVVAIRGEDHTVVEAIQRQIGHTAYHVGQIVFLAKHLSSASWKSLTIPRGQSKGTTVRYKNR